MNNQDDKSLSGLWRTNASKDPGTDLASVLDAARIIAQSLLPDTEVTFSGVQTATTEMKQIFLPARDIGSEFPVPGDIVDRLLGLTVHKVGLRLFCEDRAVYIRKIADRLGITGTGGYIYRRADFNYLKNVIEVFEDIYVDHLMTAYPGYHDYLRRERAATLAEFDLANIAKPLMVKCDRNDMLNSLIYLALLGGKLPDKITTENMDILAKLADLADKMSTKKLDKDKAIMSAYKLLTTLPEFVDHNQDGLVDQIKQDEQQQELSMAKPSDNNDESSGETDQKSDNAEPTDAEPESGDDNTEPEEEPEDGQEEIEWGDESGEEEGDGDEGDEPEEIEEDGDGDGDWDETTETDEGQPQDGDTEQSESDQWEPVNLADMLNDLVDDNTPLDAKTAKEVSKAVIEKRADLSQLLSYLAKDSDHTILAYTPSEGAGAVTDARSHTAEVEEKLRRILQDYRLKRTRDYRGLLSGRVSSRRLYRAAYGDQRVFQRRERPEEIDLVVCLLMDLSGSMDSSRNLIEQVVCAITDAFTKEKLEFIALGYSGGGNNVFIPRLYDKETGKVNLELEKEWGSTPSYEGLAAAIAQLLRLGGNKKKILCHFTDGAPNSGGTTLIPNLLTEARGKGIADIHVYIGYDLDFTHFKSIYGKDALSISDISQLPKVIDIELRKKLEFM